jgi:hypothetical protein
MNAILVSKADDPLREAYSAFRVDRFDLGQFLRHRKVERVFITGLTADYCVRETALDARAAGFTVYLVEDAVRGVAPETTAQAAADFAERLRMSICARPLEVHGKAVEVTVSFGVADSEGLRTPEELVQAAAKKVDPIRGTGWKKVEDEIVRHRWVHQDDSTQHKPCPKKNEAVYVSPDFYAEGGTPVCPDCEEGLCYDGTEILEE